jgi:hypothetical protein
MARIRSVKPDLRISRVVAAWPMPARYAFVLLWGYLDDFGRGIDDVRLIVADCFPLDRDVTERKMETWLTLYATASPEKPAPICRYVVAGQGYLHSVNWHEHQRVNRPTKSKLPPCPIHESLTELLSEDSVSDSLRARKEMEMEMEMEVVAAPMSADATAQTLVGEWIDHCGDVRPPGRVIGQVSREIAVMLGEGIPYADVRRGLAAWHTKGLHPSTLPSVVHEMRTVGTRSKSTTDDRVQSALDLAAELRAEEASTNVPAIGA